MWSCNKTYPYQYRQSLAYLYGDTDQHTSERSQLFDLNWSRCYGNNPCCYGDFSGYHDSSIELLLPPDDVDMSAGLDYCKY